MKKVGVFLFNFLTGAAIGLTLLLLIDYRVSRQLKPLQKQIDSAQVVLYKATRENNEVCADIRRTNGAIDSVIHRKPRKDRASSMTVQGPRYRIGVSYPTETRVYNNGPVKNQVIGTSNGHVGDVIVTTVNQTGGTTAEVINNN